MIGSLVPFKSYMPPSLLDMLIAITSALGQKRARIKRASEARNNLMASGD
jgi:hypothetical protein